MIAHDSLWQLMTAFECLPVWAANKNFAVLVFLQHQDSWRQLAAKVGPLCRISDLSFDMRVSRVWHFKGTVCTVILRCCKLKSDNKCRSYVTLKHPRLLKLKFDHVHPSFPISHGLWTLACQFLEQHRSRCRLYFIYHNCGIAHCLF